MTVDQYQARYQTIRADDLRDEIVDLIARYSSTFDLTEQLAVSAWITGEMLGWLDDGKPGEKEAVRIINRNIEAGRRAAMAERHERVVQ